MSALPPSMSPWKRALRATRVGALCGIGPSLILFGWYAWQNRHLPLPFAKMGAISALIGTFTGAALGGCVQLLVAWSEHVRGGARAIANPLTAGLVGGAIASTLAGIFAIAVFGSYRGPYVGTLPATALLVAACASIAIVLTMDPRARSFRTEIARASSRVLFAAILTAGIALLAIVILLPSVFSTGVFWTARAAIAAHGMVTVGCVLGVTVGAIFGMHLGLSLWLGRRA